MKFKIKNILLFDVTIKFTREREELFELISSEVKYFTHKINKNYSGF